MPRLGAPRSSGELASAPSWRASAAPRVSASIAVTNVPPEMNGAVLMPVRLGNRVGCSLPVAASRITLLVAVCPTAGAGAPHSTANVRLLAIAVTTRGKVVISNSFLRQGTTTVGSRPKARRLADVERIWAGVDTVVDDLKVL